MQTSEKLVFGLKKEVFCSDIKTTPDKIQSREQPCAVAQLGSFEAGTLLQPQWGTFGRTLVWLKGTVGNALESVLTNGASEQ